MPEEAPLQPVRVWDLPTRVFHWALAACFVGMMITGEVGGDAMAWHMRLGYVVATLLLFRVVWGVVGGHWSRFRSFALAPRSVLAYLRGQPDAQRLGHNPLGSWSVVVLLLLLLAQVATGLISDSQGEFTGPLSARVAEATGKLAASYHKRVGQNLLLLLALLHFAAVAYHQWGRRHDLIGPMWHGDKLAQGSAAASRDSAGTRWAALAVLAVCAALVAGLIIRLGS